jgi:hypothetical protein
MKSSFFILIVFSFLLQSCDYSKLIYPETVQQIYKETDATGTVHYYCYFSVQNSATVPCQFTIEDHNDAMHFQLVSMDYLKGSQPAIYHQLAPNQTIELKYEIKNWSGAPGLFDSIRMMAEWEGDEQHDEEKVDLKFGVPSSQAIYYVKADDTGNGQYFHAIINNFLIPSVNEAPPSTVSKQITNSQVVEIYNPNDFAIDIFVNNNPPKANCTYDGALRDDATANWLPIAPHQSTSGYGNEFQTAYPTAPCMNALAVSYIYCVSSQWTTLTDQTKWIALRCITK